MVISLQHTTTSPKSKDSAGFTIVELLIVIVVIGILAAITIVSFNGVQTRAREAQMKSDLSSVYRKMLADKVLTEAFPLTLASADGGKGISPTSGGTYQYSVDNTTSPATFCVTYVKDGAAYYVNQGGQVVSGACAGHSLSGTVVPTMAGYYDFTFSGSMTNLPMPTIPDGSWMMIVVAYNPATDAVAPSGWTTLYPRYTAGTLQTMIFAKMKTSSDPATFSVTNLTANTANGVLMWGTGAGDIANWIKGTTANRSGTAAQQYITTTPTITTTAAQSLVLSISTERTTATETDVSSVTGGTKWFFIAQPDANKIQTITVTSAVVATPGASTPVVVTYPNLQTVNASAVQIALPPSS